jgi:hypothetical protein
VKAEDWLPEPALLRAATVTVKEPDVQGMSEDWMT